jgi:hypothetical protein
VDQLLSDGSVAECPYAWLPTVIGRSLALPDGEFTITREQNEAVLSAIGARPGGVEPHPILASVATLAASGISIEDLLALADSGAEDGPMLGECRIQTHRPLRYDFTYFVRRRFVSLERKPSRRLGSMGLFTFVASLIEPDGHSAADVTYTWILPERDSQ